MKKTKKLSGLAKLSRKLLAINESILDLKVKYHKVFSELEDLQTEKEAVEIRIKELARAKAVEGETVRPFESEEITIEVQSPRSAPRYNLKKATKLWPKEILKRVTVIDPVAVARLLNEGDLEDEDVESVVEPGEPQTPRVYIRLNRKNNEAED